MYNIFIYLELGESIYDDYVVRNIRPVFCYLGNTNGIL